MKKVLVLFCIFLGILPFSCLNRDLYTYSITELGLIAGKLSYYGGMPVQEVDFQNDTIPADTLGIELYIKEYDSKKVSHWSLAPPLVAKKMPDAAQTTISLISIESETPLATTSKVYEAGDNLIQLFTMEGYYIGANPILKSLEYLDEWQLEDRYLFKIKDTLASPGKHSFLFKITMSDGNVFDLETPVMILK